ncbi:MAG: alkaline phytoceramidase [Gammaproteobacteria bacterium]|nr:alkaline phytoceramidase [Gammaproteobacteria bacterium]
MDDAPEPFKISQWRIFASLLPGLLLASIFMLAVDPIPQPESYHLFADKRIVLQVPHAGDVLSNLALIIVGAWGLWFLSYSQLHVRAFIDGRERRNFWWLFSGVFLTGFGSGWYHLGPDNYSLVWDRLPMTMAFMGMLAVMITERVGLSFGTALLKPLLFVGVASVLWWIWTEYDGHGDLRLYLIVQFYPMVTMLLMLLFLPACYSHGEYYWGVLVFYVIAKVVEILDHQIFEFTQNVISGHSLKHLFAALAVALLLRMLYVRKKRIGILSYGKLTQY